MEVSKRASVASANMNLVRSVSGVGGGGADPGFVWHGCKNHVEGARRKGPENCYCLIVLFNQFNHLIIQLV